MNDWANVNRLLLICACPTAEQAARACSGSYNVNLNKKIETNLLAASCELAVRLAVFDPLLKSAHSCKDSLTGRLCGPEIIQFYNTISELDKYNTKQSTQITNWAVKAELFKPLLSGSCFCFKNKGYCRSDHLFVLLNTLI